MTRVISKWNMAFAFSGLLLQFAWAGSGAMPEPVLLYMAGSGVETNALGQVCLASVSAEILWTRPLCNETDRYAGWPTAIRTSKGGTLAVFSGDRASHVCPYGKVQIIRSADNGETWSRAETICDGPIDDRDAGILEMPNGDLVLFWFTSVAFCESESDRRKYKDIAAKTTSDEKRAALGSWSRRSADGGRTWSSPVRVPVMTPHGGVLLRDGRILVVGVHNYMTVGHLASDPNNPVKTLRVAESTDGGRSFRLVGQIPLGDIKDHWSLGEPTLFEDQEGALHAFIRYELDEQGNWQRKTHMLRSVSRDGGKSWTPPVRSTIDGFPPHFLRLKDGRLLCSYANRTPGRIGVYACLSNDGGKTFADADEVQLFSSTDNDLGYATTVENGDGTFLTVYYAHPAPGRLATVMGTKWRMKRNGDTL